MVSDRKIKMQVAVRTTSKGTSIPLWKHEFYAVCKTKGKFNGSKDVYIYQALEFRAGSEMPLQCRNGLSAKQLAEIWVQGVYFASASDVRRSNPELRKDRFIFQKNNADDWEPCPQYKAALGKCPELVKVENCLSWSPMSEVLNMLPRVVHPIDVQTNSVYVNGRNWHYLCGVTAIEVVTTKAKKGTFVLSMLPRKGFCMYPEEKLGGLINSPSSQWDNVEKLFEGFRDIMSSGTGFTSGSFCVQWTLSCQQFWEVVRTISVMFFLMLIGLMCLCWLCIKELTRPDSKRTTKTDVLKKRLSAALTLQTTTHFITKIKLTYETRYTCLIIFPLHELNPQHHINIYMLMYVPHRRAVNSLQGAGGIYGMVALSPSVGVYPGSGRFTSHVPIRVVQPNTHPNHSLDLATQDNVFLQEEGQQRKRQRQAAIPPVAMSFEVLNGKWQGKMRVTVCWRELIYKDQDDVDGNWAQNNLVF